MSFTDIGKSCPSCKYLTSQICLLALFTKISGYTVVNMPMSVCRLQSYVRKTRTIQIDSAKVTYIAADRDVKIYSDNTSSNGIKRNVNRNVSI